MRAACQHVTRDLPSPSVSSACCRNIIFSLRQVVVDYVAMTPSGKVFDSSLTRGAPYDVRVGAGQVPAHVLGSKRQFWTMNPQP